MSDSRLNELLEEELLDIHYQPIVDLRTGTVFAYEALSRPGSAFGTPQKLIQAAVDAGEIGRLGRLQREVAVGGASGWPIFLNIEPTEFDHGWLVRPDDPIFRHNRQVYLEITETVPLKYFEHCHSVLAEVRKKGARLAIDDLGAGFSNLKYISELEPDVVKLDRELIVGSSPGSRELGLLISITELCHQMNAEVVAEGVETLQELYAVIEAGVDYCQGNLFAPPAPGLRGIGWPEELPRHRLLERIAAARAKRQTSAEPEPEVPKEEEAAPRVVEAGVKEDTQELRVKLRQTARDLAEAQRHRESLEGRLEAAASLSGLRDDPAGQPEEQPGRPRTSRARMLPLLSLTAVVSLLLGALSSTLLWPGAASQRQNVSSPEVPPAAAGRLSAPAARAATAPAATTVASPPPAAPEPTPPTSEPPPTPAAPPNQSPVEGDAGGTDPAGELSRRELLVVVRQIEGWARAWSEQRPEEYLAFYAEGFLPEDGKTRSAWQQDRRQRIRRPSWIRITLGPLEVAGLLSGGARATFEQTYESENYRDQVKKTLDLVEENGSWRIITESSEPI